MPGERLVLTLRYLATGDCYGTLHFAVLVGKSTVADIVKETCEAIYAALSEQYLKVKAPVKNPKNFNTYI